MTTQEAIKQLRDLIKDRQSFLDNDEELLPYLRTSLRLE